MPSRVMADLSIFKGESLSIGISATYMGIQQAVDGLAEELKNVEKGARHVVESDVNMNR